MNAQSVRTAATKSLRPSRLNLAGFCIYCAKRGCSSAQCVADYARSVWVLCDRCGGSEWVNGHVDPEAACHRCDCFGGLTDASDDGELAEVIDFPGAPQVKVSSGPVVIGYSAQGRPVIRDHAGRVSEVFDINDPEAWF